MATDELTLNVTCPQCDEPIAMPTSARHTGQGNPQVALDTRAVYAHLAAHGVRVQSSPSGPAVQIINNADIYPGILADERRHGELLDWLRANGIEPYDIPTDGTVSIEPAGSGHAIRHTAMIRNANGRHYLTDPANPDKGLATEERATPLAIPLPDSWPQPVQRAEPTQES